MMNDVSIVIATFRRPQLLEKTILSCLNQHNFLKLKYQIIVVDNSSEKSAETVVDRLAKEHSNPITYVNEPRQNISLARNAGMAHSNAHLIAFIDDDEEAGQDWLDHLVRTLRKYSADAVFGPVTPIIELGERTLWNSEASFSHNYVKNIPTGTSVTFGYTGNVLLRYDTCLSEGQRFDPEFGLTGGGDTDFFMRLSKMGLKFVWCAEAEVKEFIPESRRSVRYIMRQSFHRSQNFVRCSIRNSDHPLLTASYWTASGLGQIAVWIIPNLIMAPFKTPFSVYVRRRLIRGTGKVLWAKCFRIDLYA